MKKITGRDVRFFLLGVLIMFLVQIAFSWEDFKAGFNGGYNETRINNTVE